MRIGLRQADIDHVGAQGTIDLHTDVKSEDLKKSVDRRAYCVDPKQVATAIIVKLALNDDGSLSAWRGGPSPRVRGDHHSRRAG